jgi:hypothetical protein
MQDTAMVPRKPTSSHRPGRPVGRRCDTLVLGRLGCHKLCAGTRSMAAKATGQPHTSLRQPLVRSQTICRANRALNRGDSSPGETVP